MSEHTPAVTIVHVGPMDRARRIARALLLGWLPALLLALFGAVPEAHASGGSYATAGTGTYAQSLWWLDFSGYSNASAAAGGQAYSFTLPSGAGVLSTTLTLSGNGTLTAVATPVWSGGGAFGHGAYNGITGSPGLYWLNQPGSPGTVALNSLVVKDTAGNVRSFVLYAADGENTNTSESIVYTSTAAWKLIDTVNYYANYNGTVPGIAGTGTTTVTETGPTAGDGNYNASIILGTQSPTQASAALSNNEAVLFAVAIPTVTLTVNVASRVSAGDQFTAGIAYTSPLNSLKTASTSGSATTATTGAISVIGNNGITLSTSMLAGSASALSYYTGSIACTNSGPGAVGYGGTNTVLPSGAGVSFTVTPEAGDAIACTLTVTPATQTLTGTVYGDTNHDAALDNGETGTGVSGLYVKLAAYSGGACQTPATAAAAVNSSTGAYSVTGVTAGTYCLTLTNSNGLSNVNAYLPSGYVGTEAASGLRTVTVSASPTPVQNFGLFSGSTASVLVFSDIGSGGGTANDGVQNGTEAGIGNVVVTATSGGTAFASATTSANGTALLWLPSTAQGTTVTLTPTPPSATTPTGGTAGTTGGSYARPSVSYTDVVGQAYTGISFGLIPASTFAANGAQSVLPGGIVFYPQTFTAGSGGTVTFGTTAIASPTLNGWSETIYLDTTCSGQYATTDTLVTTSITASAGQIICILVREFAPATAPTNATDKMTVSAAFSYSGTAAPAAVTLTETDLSTVSGSGSLQVIKQVQNLTSGGAYSTADSALPGQTLQYQIAIVNQGASALASVIVDDATPAFTTFLSASCPAAAALPTGLTSCTVVSQPAAGSTGGLQWTFAGSLAAGAGATVTYQVKVGP